MTAAIDILTEDALLEIFEFYLDDDDTGYNDWHTLVHVCQRWRNIVFGSSHYLDLQLLCTPTTPVRVSLHIWPPLPITIYDEHDSTSNFDNVIAAIEHNDRVCEVTLEHLSFSQLNEAVARMEQPFPELTYLELRTKPEMWLPLPSLPSSFLGVSAPYLIVLKLFGIPFPALPKLLLSTPDLETLFLCNIPDFKIPPNVMLGCLSALTCLEKLCIDFYSFRAPLYSPPNRPSRRRKRVFLPVLRRFLFTGSSGYVEHLLNWIDAPLLGRLVINLFEEEELTYDTPQLARFISRTPMFEAPIEARVFIESGAIRVVIPSSKRVDDSEAITVQIYCTEPDRQLWCLAQVCRTALPCLSTVEHLYISDSILPPLDWPDDIENTRWWDLLRPFTALKNLYLSEAFAPRIAPALQELFRESVTEVLPKLQNIFLEDFQPSDPAKTAIWQFVTGSRVDGHHMTVAHWDRELCTWEEDYEW